MGLRFDKPLKVGEMNKKTLTALQASIKHWEENVAATHPMVAKPYAEACALCKMFMKDSWCTTCPVRAHTKQDQCMGTPWRLANECYKAWYLAVETPGCSQVRRSQAHQNWIAAAKRELEFLKSLLPVKRKKKRK